jgi:hypothetical protein
MVRKEKKNWKRSFYFFTVCRNYTLNNDNAIFFCCFRNNFYPIFPPTKDPNTLDDIPLLGPEGPAACDKAPLTDIKNGWKPFSSAT